MGILSHGFIDIMRKSIDILVCTLVAAIIAIFVVVTVILFVQPAAKGIAILWASAINQQISAEYLDTSDKSPLMCMDSIKPFDVNTYELKAQAGDIIFSIGFYNQEGRSYEIKFIINDVNGLEMEFVNCTPQQAAKIAEYVYWGF